MEVYDWLFWLTILYLAVLVTALAASLIAIARALMVTIASRPVLLNPSHQGISSRVIAECVSPTLSLRQRAVASEPLLERAEQLRRDGQTVMLIAVDGLPAGLVGVADPIKATPAKGRRIRDPHRDWDLA